ncbi:MAG TPA: ferredoxin family protein [Candidatus Ratteibacteria bacterium]|nr:ferredoxin family protein [bacterium]HRR96048.1 ferredoxin family protein [Candidatus Ratteibacteria bacterium]
MFEIKVKNEKCKGCKLCIEVCPKNVFKISTHFNKLGVHYAIVDKENNCNGCKRCVIICPDIAIEIYQKEKGGKNEDRGNT